MQVIAWRTVSEMAYKVSSGTLNFTRSLTHSLTHSVYFSCIARTWQSAYWQSSSFSVYFAMCKTRAKVISFCSLCTRLNDENLYLLICRRFGKRCCLLWNDFRLPLDGATMSRRYEGVGRTPRLFSSTCLVLFWCVFLLWSTIGPLLLSASTSNSFSMMH